MALNTNHPTHNTAVGIREDLDALIDSVKREIDALRDRGMKGDDKRIAALQPRFLAYEEARDALVRAGL